eukprot:scaffold4036_cov115-Isochrysis_galbana.AAC.6
MRWTSSLDCRRGISSPDCRLDTANSSSAACSAVGASITSSTWLFRPENHTARAGRAGLCSGLMDRLPDTRSRR